MNLFTPFGTRWKLMTMRWLRHLCAVSLLMIPQAVSADLMTSMFGMAGMIGMFGMSGMSGMFGMGGMSGMGMGMLPGTPIVGLIAGNMRNTRGWYEQRSSGQLILYPIFPLQPALPSLPLSPSASMATMSNLNMAATASMLAPQSYAFIASQGWYTIDINGILTLHPTSSAVNLIPPSMTMAPKTSEKPDSMSEKSENSANMSVP